MTDFPTHTYGPDEPCSRQCELLVVVVAWHRPEMLMMTLDSLTEQLVGVDYCLIVAVNETTPEMEAVVRGYSNACLNASAVNRGINRAIEDVVSLYAERQFKYIMVSDGDIYYQEYLLKAMRILDDLSVTDAVGMVSFQHAPETPCIGVTPSEDGTMLTLKRYDRCGMMLMKMERFQQLRPLPVHKLVDFDWWVMRDAPESLMNRGQIVACWPKAGIHVAYKKSTWSKWDTPEYPECRKQADALYAIAVREYQRVRGSVVQGADGAGSPREGA